MHELKTLPGSAQLVRSTVIYYMATTLGAACIGMFIGYVVLTKHVKEAELDDDGDDDDDDGDDDGGSYTALDQVEGIAYGLVPSNIVDSAATSNLLGGRRCLNEPPSTPAEESNPRRAPRSRAGIITFFVVLGALVNHRVDAPEPARTSKSVRARLMRLDGASSTRVEERRREFARSPIGRTAAENEPLEISRCASSVEP